MPGMEVFTISGASVQSLGAWAIDPNTRQAVVVPAGPGTFPSRAAAEAAAQKIVPMATQSRTGSYGGSPAVLLQNALVALGNTRGDSTLNIAIDGAVGPGTVKALNYALKTYVGAGPLQKAGLGGRFLNATATKTDVMQYVGTLAQVVTQAVQSAGGSVPPPPAVSARTHSSRSSGSAASTPDAPPDAASGHPALPWIIGGASLVVLGLGFMAARRHAA